MTRPNIVRADTIDLQDQDNPTAADHQKHPDQHGLAPHQASQVHHVQEERHSEEQALSDAWNLAGDVSEEPGTIEQAQANGEQAPANGTQQDGEDGGGGGDSESEGEEDMMDRISSSPSIEDGGYTLHSSPPPTPRTACWPARMSSSSPIPTPSHTSGGFNSSATSTSTPDSSPFLQTPEHLPLHVGRASKEASPLPRMMREELSSPFGESPRLVPAFKLWMVDDVFSFLSEHRPMGRYGSNGDYESSRLEQDEGFHDGSEQRHVAHVNSQNNSGQPASSIVVDPAARPIESPFRRHFWIRRLTDLSEPYLEQSPSLTSIDSVDLTNLLLPMDDPILNVPLSPTGSSDSWESIPESEPGSLNHNNIVDARDLFLTHNDRFIDSGWGGECLRDTEDIDFEFVYALHTFVATVEGQANATKGDTMVLLDDSNSYWWLVRVVKDSSIGYLPAEHIETPLERLARLNKHRNIDLSATMLSDNSEKTRSPLNIKKAMRRRNARTVQFAAPTYVEASDYDYSTEDEEHAMIESPATAAQGELAPQSVQPTEQETNGSYSDTEETAGTPTRGSFEREQAATAALAPLVDEPQLSPKLIDKTEAAPLKSRKGTPRNTDSFLKDDSIETRKITLTPGLLREDGVTSLKSPSLESTHNNSVESLVRQVSPSEQQQLQLSKKDGKDKKKEKQKGGILSGLFKSKKKDKKYKDDASTESDADKPSMELQRESPRASPLPSDGNSPVDKSLAPQSLMDNRPQSQARQAPARGKLQKAPPSITNAPVREHGKEHGSAFVAELEGSEAAFEMATGRETNTPEQPHSMNNEVAPQSKDKDGSLTAVATTLRSNGDKDVKPTMAKRTKQRMELDDFDSPADGESPNLFKEPEERARDEGDDQVKDRLSESPVEITPGTFMHGTENIHIPTPGSDEQEEEEEEDDEEEAEGEEEEPESLTSSPSIIEHPVEPHEKADSEAMEDNDPTPTAPLSPQPLRTETDRLPERDISIDGSTYDASFLSTSPPVQRWSDSSLRAWYDDTSEVKDMLVMIHDKSGVTPVSADHPMMAGLFVEERKGVQAIMGQLDGLLGSYLQRKGISF